MATDLAPASERVISDVETLKALSDPVRLRILETMVQTADEDWTVKRLAMALGVGPTKLYHHVAVLEEHEFIRVSGKRVVSGIIETRYRIAQLSVRLDRALISGSGPADETAAALDEVLRSIFDTAREDVARALRSGALELDPASGSGRGILRQDLTRLSPARAAELRDRLVAVLTEFDVDESGPDAGEAQAYGVLVALYPVTAAADDRRAALDAGPAEHDGAGPLDD
jgi:DNA-binding transcriptional ArsR family regulator